MDLARRAGIAIVFGVPAIVGAGLTWSFAENWQAVFGYLGLLGFIAAGFILNPERMSSSEDHSE
jgi:hypothetical protein